MIQDNSSPFHMVHYAFRIFGFMIYEDRPWSLLYSSYHWLIINTFGITSLLGVFLGSGTLEDTVGSLSSFAMYLMTIAKMVTYILKEKEIRDLLKRLENLRLEILEDKENRDYVIVAANKGRKILMVLSAYVLTGAIIGFIKQTIYDYMTDFTDRRLFLQIWVPWSTVEIWPYIIEGFLVTLMAESAVFANLPFAIFHFTFTIQMSTYLRILQKYFETKGPADKSIYRQHKVMIQLIQDYNDIFSAQMFLETLVAPIMPCGFGLIFIRDLRKNEFNQLDAFQKLSSCFLPSIIVCSCGQEIMTQAERLHEASYMSKWYEEKPKVRKDLLMLMTRTTKATTMNYRHYFRFDHQRLANVNNLFVQMNRKILNYL
ncbi:hypothetical protein O3M35_007710 [Rhynocoris fuscipes]|uniref:Odorant receptor n=1 Tax=Rhynocoris fuscipes TaxID=488301 RepID=A0AAW1DHN8_9HEMI